MGTDGPLLKLSWRCSRPGKVINCAFWTCAFFAILVPVLHLVSRRAMGPAAAQDYPGYPHTIMAPEHGASRITVERRNVERACAGAVAVIVFAGPLEYCRRAWLVWLGAADAAAAHAAHCAGRRRRSVSSCRAAAAGHRLPCRASPIPFRICRTAQETFQDRASRCVMQQGLYGVPGGASTQYMGACLQ